MAHRQRPQPIGAARAWLLSAAEIGDGGAAGMGIERSGTKEEVSPSGGRRRRPELGGAAAGGDLGDGRAAGGLEGSEGVVELAGGLVVVEGVADLAAPPPAPAPTHRRHAAAPPRQGAAPDPVLRSRPHQPHGTPNDLHLPDGFRHLHVFQATYHAAYALGDPNTPPFPSPTTRPLHPPQLGDPKSTLTAPERAARAPTAPPDTDHAARTGHKTLASTLGQPTPPKRHATRLTH